MLDFLSGEEESNFNKDPFQLGTFEQIAHYRLGKTGRARRFSLSARARTTHREYGERRSQETRLITYQINFESVDGQAQITSIDISGNQDQLTASLGQNGLEVQVTSEGRTYSVERLRSFPRVARSEISRYWPLILRDLRFRVSRDRDGAQSEMFDVELRDTLTILSNFAGAFSRQLSTPVLATSAIRTNPRRTYTPGTESEDGQGTHVPYEMAKLARGKKETWKRIQDSIESYGRSSEMFSKVHVKTFGKSASDPFQIQFSLGGPRVNMVDLGYGTSQVLPILYNIASSRTNTRFLIQQPEVHLHPRAQAALGQHIVDRYRDSGRQFVIETHSDFIVDRIRMAVADRAISADDVSILFFERDHLETSIKEIQLDKDGEPVNPPESYRNFFLGEQLRLLGVEL